MSCDSSPRVVRPAGRPARHRRGTVGRGGAVEPHATFGLAFELAAARRLPEAWRLVDRFRAEYPDARPQLDGPYSVLDQLEDRSRRRGKAGEKGRPDAERAAVRLHPDRGRP